MLILFIYLYFALLCTCGMFKLAEVAQDSLERTGKYQVIEGIVSPVSDSYPKKVCLCLVGLFYACVYCTFLT